MIDKRVAFMIALSTLNLVVAAQRITHVRIWVQDICLGETVSTWSDNTIILGRLTLTSGSIMSTEIKNGSAELQMV